MLYITRHLCLLALGGWCRWRAARLCHEVGLCHRARQRGRRGPVVGLPVHQHYHRQPALQPCRIWAQGGSEPGRHAGGPQPPRQPVQGGGAPRVLKPFAASHTTGLAGPACWPGVGQNEAPPPGSSARACCPCRCGCCCCCRRHRHHWCRCRACCEGSCISAVDCSVACQPGLCCDPVLPAVHRSPTAQPQCSGQRARVIVSHEMHATANPSRIARHQQDGGRLP